MNAKMNHVEKKWRQRLQLKDEKRLEVMQYPHYVLPACARRVHLYIHLFRSETHDDNVKET